MSNELNIDQLKDMAPFYVNGTLADGEKAQFEAALNSSPELRRIVSDETELQANIHAGMQAELGAEMGTAPSGEAPRVQSFMGSPPPLAEDYSGGSGGGLAGALSFLNPANWKPAVTFALAAAAVGQAAIIGGQFSTIGDQDAQIAQLEADNYVLASGACDCDGDSDTSIILELSEDAVWSQVAELLAREKLLISRSTAQGVLMLRHTNKDADMKPVIERLNASPLVANASKAA